MNRSNEEWGNGRECEVTHVIGKLIQRGFQFVDVGQCGHTILGLRMPSADVTVAVMHGDVYAMDIYDRGGHFVRVAAKYRSQSEFLKAVDRCISDEMGALIPTKDPGE